MLSIPITHAKYVAYPMGDKERVYKKIIKFFNMLPIVFYQGCGGDEGIDFVHYSHGGPEVGYNPKSFFQSGKKSEWIQSFNRETEGADLPDMTMLEIDGKQTRPLKTYFKNFVAESSQKPYCLGQIWTDLEVDPKGLCRDSKKGDGYSALLYNKELTLALLLKANSPSHRLVSIVRAHQHRSNDKEPIMHLYFEHNGCTYIWKEGHVEKIEPGAVISLLLSPDSLMGMPTKIFRGFEYDTTLKIERAKTLPWKATVLNHNVYRNRAKAGEQTAKP